MKDINKIEMRGTIMTINVNIIEGRKCARFSLRTDISNNDFDNEVWKATYNDVIAWEGTQTDPAIFTAERCTYVHLIGHLKNRNQTDDNDTESTYVEAVRLKCNPRELHMEKENPEWRFAYDEDIFDMLGYNSVGVLTNGESFLFYHIIPTDEDKIPTCHIFASMMNMYECCPEISYPATEENDNKVLEALNSLTIEDYTRFCGENSILHEIKFK